MSKNLVIVESPAKAKTIGKVLGKDFEVTSCYGHICDLAKKNLGIDKAHGFLPTYEILPEKTELVKKLTRLAKGAETVWLASDDDREGEAISWHLKEQLQLANEKTHRIAFHEITKDAIQNAIQNPRQLNENLVMAQQARRVLDRIVGYELSPILWKKVQPKLSAGRVQSVALRLVVEREREILEFTSSSQFKVEGKFAAKDVSRSTFKAELNHKFATEEDAAAFLTQTAGATYAIDNVENKQGHRSPAPPFTTSTLQQEASRKLGLPVGQTMSLAQRLYEAGHITYMRTDSTHLSSLALSACKKVIVERYGASYAKTRQYAVKAKGAQEAHEAIRPTYMENQTIEGTAQERKLYELIWKRTLASQMQDAKVDKTQITISISNSPLQYLATGEVITFDGFLKVYSESTEDQDTKTGQTKSAPLPALTAGAALKASQITATQRFAQHPPRYSEAALVKKMEDLGIGRPSTYAPTISTINQREYVVKVNRAATPRAYAVLTLQDGEVTRRELQEKTGEERGKMSPTNVGMMVSDFLTTHFPSIVDYGFTAKMEADFDKIAAGKLVWNKMLDHFYGPFKETMDKVLEVSRPENGERLLGTDPATGKDVWVRMGRFGPMAQIGAKEDPEHRFAGLHKGQLLESITLEEALELFRLPRQVGVYQDLPAVIGIGRFGPYVKWNGKYTSLDKTDDPYTLSLSRAIEVIEQGKEKEAKRQIKEFPQEGIRILKGRFGPYLSYKKKNYKIPRQVNPEELTLEQCLELIKQ